MKRLDRILISAGCFALLLISWIIAVNLKSPAEKQIEFMRQAAELVSDGVYIRAVPLLEEAAGYDTEYTLAVEAELKRVYLALIDKPGFGRRYIGLLERQMSRRDAHPDFFIEAANYYLGLSRISEALATLRIGIERTGSAEVTAFYEDNRYAYDMNRTAFEYVSAIYGSTVQVRADGLWGIARSDGVELIPCEYEKLSTFSGDRAIALKDGEIYAIDENNNRLALLHENAADFGNLSSDRVPLLIDGAWVRATGEFALGSAVFEQIGMYSDGYAAARVNGRWGVVGLELDWLVPAEYDGIVMDELGRCCGQGAVFVRQDGIVRLIVGGRFIGEAFDDARPFSGEGFAAVMRNGRWGFIDIDGSVVIDFVFDDALSFGQHLAAVRIGELWGYVGIQGQIAIEPVFLDAKSFSNGSAPVLTQRGWQFISLIEFKRRASL